MQIKANGKERKEKGVRETEQKVRTVGEERNREQKRRKVNIQNKGQ